MRCFGLNDAEVHGERRDPAAGAVVEMGGDPAAFFILELEDTDG